MRILNNSAFHEWHGFAVREKHSIVWPVSNSIKTRFMGFSFYPKRVSLIVSLGSGMLVVNFYLRSLGEDAVTPAAINAESSSVGRRRCRSAQ